MGEIIRERALEKLNHMLADIWQKFECVTAKFWSVHIMARKDEVHTRCLQLQVRSFSTQDAHTSVVQRQQCQYTNKDAC